jgi:hypothetical protein
MARVLKAEFDRPNPAEGLAVFCEALGVTLDYYAPGQDEAGFSPGGETQGSLYADLPGLSLRSPADNALIIAGSSQRYGVLGSPICARTSEMNALTCTLRLLSLAYATGSSSMS